MPYQAKLPDGVSLPPGQSINTAHPDYKALEALAARQSLSQAAFSDALGLELARHQRAAKPPAAPAPPAPKPDFSKMSTRDQFAHALTNSPTRSPQF